MRFRIQGKEKQKIHFTNVNSNNKYMRISISAIDFDMWDLP